MGVRETQMNKPPHVLVYATTRAGGDLNPLVALCHGLLDVTATLTVLCDSLALPIFQAMGVPAFHAGPEYEVGPAVKEALQRSAGMPDVERQLAVNEAISHWLEVLRPHAAGLLEQVRPDIILTTLFGTCVGWGLHTLSGKPWAALNSTFYIGPNPPRPLARDFSVKAADIFTYSVIPYLEESALVLHATDPQFDYDVRGLPSNHIYTGPLFWEQPGEVPSYLTEPGDPWVLVTISSLRQDDTAIATTALAALSHAHHRVAVTVGRGHEVEEVGLPPANALVRQYIPHSSVLGEASLMVSHAGHGSVMKALRHGVPMLLVPWARDQFGVAARAESLGVAAVVPKEQLTIHNVAEAAARVLHDVRYREAAQAAARRMSQDSLLDEAAGAVLELAS